MGDSYCQRGLGLGATVIVSLVAIILAAIALSRQMKSPTVTVMTSGGEIGKTSLEKKRIWTVAHNHGVGAAAYMDESGYIKGFNLDLVRKVCEAAEMDCRLIWDEFNHCWDSHPGAHSSPGRGLLDGWYDACVGWVQTVERSHSLAFSKSFKPIFPAVFVVKKGNAATFNGRDLAGMKIGFIDGWSYNEQCLARQQDDNHRNYILSPENIIHISSADMAVKYLVNGTIDANLNSETVMRTYTEVEIVRSIPGFSCSLSGPAMMTRKDNDFNTYFNMGLKKIMENGEYQKLCQEANEIHGHIEVTNCLDV